VRNPGDYVRRPVGNKPVFMVRGVKSGKVHVFQQHLHAPGRRGLPAEIRQREGVPVLLPRLDVRLGGHAEGRARPGRVRREAGLRRAGAEVGGPRGELPGLRVSACFDAGAPDLVSYLAGAREYLDLVIDSADGDMEIIKGTNEYCIDANWKLLAENSVDGYHAMPTHDTYFKYLVALGTDLSGGVSGGVHDLGNGHAVLEYSRRGDGRSPSGSQLFGEHAREEIAGLRADLVTKHGEARAARMADTNRNMLIFPNLVVNDIMAVTVRTFMPLSPSRMDVTAWELAPRGELPQLRQRRLDRLPDLSRPGRLRDPGRRGGAGVLPAGLQLRRRVEWNDNLPGAWRVSTHGDDEAHDAHLLAAVGGADGAGRLVGGVPVTAVSDRGVGLDAGLDLATGTRPVVEDLLYREAALLDNWDLDGWLALWAPGPTRYVVPCNDTPDGDAANDLVLIDDDELRMRLRVERLNKPQGAPRVPALPDQPPDLQRDAGPGVRRRAAGDRFVHGVAVPGRQGQHLRGPPPLPVGRRGWRAADPGQARRLLDMTELRPAGDLAIIL